MTNRLTPTFLLLAIVFASAHAFAVTVSLYWYYWWFDIFMHLWGGVLIGLGIHALSSFRWFPFRPTTKTVLLGLFSITICWEIFEWSVGLYDHNAYVTSTLKDLFFGFSGGLFAHAMLRRYRIK